MSMPFDPEAPKLFVHFNGEQTQVMDPAAAAEFLNDITQHRLRQLRHQQKLTTLVVNGRTYYVFNDLLTYNLTKNKPGRPRRQ